MRTQKFCIDCGALVSRSKQLCRSCAGKRAYREGRVRAQLFQAREKHPLWKGGRCKTSSGHVSILLPEHHRADRWGRVLEHIAIWEQANGRELPPGYIIHHLNGIPDDNRPSNLVALPGKKHYHVLQAKAKRIQELEAQLNGQGLLL